jgi:diguanylate cyclase (GGDEF)-like protein/PAS domain S-box-containing protein
MQIGVTVTDLEGRILYTNPADASIHGYSVDELVGCDATIYTGGEPRRAMSREQIMRMKSWRRESQNQTKTGAVVPVRLMSDLVIGESGEPLAIVTTCEDISERKRVEEQIERLAYRDTLTGLPNRRLFNDRLNIALLQAHRAGERVAVLFVDLDGFKLVNDSLGHDVGDRLLCEVAQRLEACVRQGDTVARLGGDEFTLLLPAVARPLDLEIVADKVLAALRPPFELAGQQLFLSASMGVALYPDHGLNVETLVKNADAAMYRAKEMGRDTFRVYAREMSAVARDRLAMESGLRNALRAGELEAYYQPIAWAGSGKLRGFEALVRWRHPAKGLLAPDEFIPMAEMTGLVVPLGVWILKEACRQLVRWRERGYVELGMAVNLSGRHVQHPGLLEHVREALEESGAPASRLTLEITETASMQKVEQTLGAMQALRSLGVRISIDDFGTGYSSLGHLNRFPIDALKIDRSFVADIGPGRGQPIAEAVIALAHTLDLDVIAEGVETEAQRALLERLHCDALQGHLFSPALPAVGCDRFLESYKPIPGFTESPRD